MKNSHYFGTQKGCFFKESNLFAVMRVKGDLNTVFSGSTRSGLSTAEGFVEKVCCCTEFGIE